MSTDTPSLSRPVWRRKGAGFLGEDSGAYTIFAVIGFAMLMGMVGLVVDVGRVMNIHTQASSYADRVALAAAGELDARRGAIRRAVTQARNIVDNERVGLTGDRRVGIRQIEFLSSIGPDPANPDRRGPIPGDTVVRRWRSGEALPSETDGANGAARFALVTTTNETENFLFLPIAGLFNQDLRTSATVAPQAVAGFQRSMCNSAPIMVCNPSESNFGIGADFRSRVGDRLDLNLQGNLQLNPLQRLRWSSNNYAMFSVNSGVLGIPLNISLRNLIGRTDPGTACYSDRIRPRNVSGMRLDLNLQTPVGDLQLDLRRGLNDRYDNGGRTFPAAVVNCRQNNALLLLANQGLNVEVPVEAYARVRMANRVGTDLVLHLQILDKPTPSLNAGPDQLREYPVLVR